ncbi:MAG: hypothetical protein VXZ59_09175 [Cyanobacteriota bacterium]|nr:hypothetical protein [Cyanobacteriota bacterium]
MLTQYAERYVLRNASSGLYLGINALDQTIQTDEKLSSAWAFHTHDAAVTHAQWIGQVHGEIPEVVKI